MKNVAITALVAIITASTTSAQTADSGSESTAQSYVYQGGSEIPKQAPSMGAPGLMHTGPCTVSTSGALSAPGMGISLGGGRLDEACDIRAGAAALAAVVGQRAAAEHLCLDDKMRSTLEPMGFCTIHTAQKTKTKESQTAYTSCRFDKPSAEHPRGAMKLRVRRGADREVAIAQCRAALGR